MNDIFDLWGKNSYHQMLCLFAVPLQKADIHVAAFTPVSSIGHCAFAVAAPLTLTRGRGQELSVDKSFQMIC